MKLQQLSDTFAKNAKHNNATAKFNYTKALAECRFELSIKFKQPKIRIMKRTQNNLTFQILFGLLFLSSFFPVTAQTEKKVLDKFYLQMAAGPVSQKGSSGDFSLQETTIENKTTVGAMLKADINCAVSPYMGLGAGMFANFNNIKSPIGFQVKFMLGLMGVEKNKKKPINRNQHRSNKKIQ